MKRFRMIQLFQMSRKIKTVFLSRKIQPSICFDFARVN